MFKTAFSNQNIDKKGLKYAGVNLRELCILLRLVCKRRGIFYSFADVNCTPNGKKIMENNKLHLTS